MRIGQRHNKKRLTTAILCNSNIITSKQIQDALNSELNKFCKIDEYYITQFPWDAAEHIAKERCDFLFVDEVTESNRALEPILMRIRRNNEHIKIVLFTSYVSDLTRKMMNEHTIDTYILMPFQASHIIHALADIVCTEEENEETIEI